MLQTFCWDALCLDPFAEVFLGQRAEFLLADSGAALHRLLRRFHHIASISASALDTSKLDSYLKLYLDSDAARAGHRPVARNCTVSLGEPRQNCAVNFFCGR